MTSRPYLYVICISGTLAALSADGNSAKTRRLLEARAAQDSLRTANIIGDTIPERFYVINEDTAYTEIDGVSAKDFEYLTRRK